MTKQKPTTARGVALCALTACAKQGAWSDGILRNLIRTAGLDRRDAALATRICYGVQQNQLLCDFWIDQFSTVKREKLEPAVAVAMQLGMYQMVFLDKVPARAAVSESVDLVKTYSKNPRSANLVNGVLRSFSRALGNLPQPAGEERLSILYSHPQWLVSEFQSLLGAETEQLLLADNTQPETCLQVNPLKADWETVLDQLNEAGVSAEAHPWLPGCLLVTGTGNLEQLPQFQSGEVTVQDAAAKLSVLACDPKPGHRVLDVCAAPGGKSFAAAMEMDNQGEIVACDIHPHKKKLVEQGAARLGVTILAAQVQDGKEFCPEWKDTFDRVIVDAPCSGLGIIRKKPDIRYKDPKPLAGLPRVQRGILDNVSNYVRPGGVLLYSTCTLLRRENEDVVNGFLSGHPEFQLEPFWLPEPVGHCPDGMVTLWPHIHQTDGFFLAKLRRSGGDASDA